MAKRHPGGKVHEPIIGCQAATALLLLRNRICPVSRTQAGDLHEEGGDGGCGGGCVCVRALSCECACMCVFAWMIDCVCLAGLGHFNVALRVCVFSDGV